MDRGPSDPLRIGVVARSAHATDLAVAVTAVVALERVAPFAVVTLVDEPHDVAVEAADDAVGVIGDGSAEPALRAGRIARGSRPAPLIEDDAGRWFRSDDDGQRVEVRDLDAWALLGMALDAPQFRASSPAGGRLERVVRRRRDELSGFRQRGEEAVADLEQALRWARDAVDGALAQVAAQQPSRLRGWLTQQGSELEFLRASHDALRGRYHADLELVLGTGIADG